MVVISDARLDELKNRNALKEYVVEYIKENYDPEERQVFFSDLLQHGCVSGMVNDLIYYSDTHTFFDRFYEEIEELREEWEENTGEPIKIKGDLKNDLAWFAFEETVYQLSSELELDL